ncbi:MAG: molybdopterin-binding protein [Candidatus Dormibacteraceae bacterium]
MASSIIAIGDELLSGFTLDTNTHWLAERLRLLGHPLKRATQVRDRQVEIVEQLHRDVADPEIDVIVCTGGLGPTTDDRTFPAVAAALRRELVVWEETRQRIENRLARMLAAGLVDSADLNEGHLRMATIPADPAAVLGNRVGSAPGVLYETDGTRIFILPGVPPEMKAIFIDEVEPRLTGGSVAEVRELRLKFAVEGRFYTVMKELETTHPDVAVGSYPNFESKELILRCSGADAARVESALSVLTHRAKQMGYA